MPRRNLRAVVVVAVISLLCLRSSLSAKPRDEMMEDIPTAQRSLETLRELRPAAVHFCHDNRTWVAR